MVGAAGFEPATSCSQSMRANQAALRPVEDERVSEGGRFGSTPAIVDDTIDPTPVHQPGFAPGHRLSPGKDDQMKTTTERLDPTKVKLTVEVEPKRVSKAFDDAARDIAQQVQIPGFRKGKVPRRLLEQKVGKEAIRAQALEGAVSTFYAEAIQAEELFVVAPPEIDLQHFDEDEGCAFEATVEVRPEIELPDYEGIDVQFPEWDVTDEEVEERLEELRERFSELDEVDRPAKTGDYVTLDLEVSRDGEVIEDATAEDALYEVGSGGVTPKLDEELIGVAAEETLVYEDELPEGYPVHGGETVEFTVKVHDVRQRSLPELDDDFAMTASEFDTIDELRRDIRENLLRQKIPHARQELRGQILEAYLALVDVPLPEAMVEGEREGRIEQIGRQAEQYGLDLDQLLEAQGMDPEQFQTDVAEQARTAVKAQLVLEALTEKLELEVESAELGREIQRHATEHGVDPREIARVINEQGHAGVLIGDLLRRKALDALVEAADVTGGPPEEVLEELGLTGAKPAESAVAPAGAGEDPGEGTEPHTPSLGEAEDVADDPAVEDEDADDDLAAEDEDADGEPSAKAGE
jgi:trigger factor